MTNRSEDSLMHQVRDQFATWEPQAPAGVQQAVYAQLGKTGFWHWNRTTLNVWYLGLALLGATTLWGGTRLNEDQSAAQTLPATEQRAVTWEAFYPEQPAACSTETSEPATQPTSLASQPVWKPVALQAQEGPLYASIDGELMEARGPQPLNTLTLVPELNTSGTFIGKVDIWSQLQDSSRDELRLVFNVTVPEE